MAHSHRSFGIEDQERFARWSGDRNPMHMDPVAARRTAAGVAAVHGIHSLIWMLDQVAPACGGRRPARIEARFLRFIPVGAAVECSVVRDRPERLDTVLMLDGAPAVALVLRWAAQGLVAPARATPRRLDAGAASMGPAVLGWEDLAGLGGEVAAVVGGDAAEAVYPGAAGLLPPGGIAGLMAATRLVGMVCPGLHSVFAELKLEVDPAHAAPMLRYAVQEVDARFRTVAMGVAGFGLVGELKTYMRQPPVVQPGIEALRPLVGPDEFRGTTALIVGGSRGLGELTAKLLAAGGGDCLITYATGAEDAGRVGQEIRDAGCCCDVLRLDASAPLAAQLGGVPDRVNQAYYFATTKIFRQGTAVFDAKAYADFSRIYVGAFHELCAVFAGAGRATPVFYPSSVAVEARPRGMTEYAMAKAAGETLCEDLGRWLPGVRIVMRRLPRLLTDQTATTNPVRAEDAVATMLEAVRAMHGRPTGSGHPVERAVAGDGDAGAAAGLGEVVP